MLGTTVPEPTSEKVDQYVCSAGLELDDDYEPQGLIRLYPFGLNNYPKRWSVSEVVAVKHPRDSRTESYLPQSVLHLGELPRSEKAVVRVHLGQFAVSGIAEANAKKVSLAVIIKPGDPKFWLDPNDVEGEPSYHLYQGGEPLKSRQRFKYTPRLQYTSPDGKRSRKGHQVRDWQFYELMRKRHDVIDNLEYEDQVKYIGKPMNASEKSLLLIGNLANYRTSWVIISVLNI